MNGRFEVRSKKDLTVVWKSVLPLTHGDCEISPLANGGWLAVNSCGIRLAQLVDQKLKISC